MTRPSQMQAPTAAASPDILAFRDEPAWEAARRTLGLVAGQRPVAIALPRTVDDVAAVADHARIFGVDRRAETVEALDGVLLVGLTELPFADVEEAVRIARADVQPGDRGGGEVRR